MLTSKDTVTMTDIFGDNWEEELLIELWDGYITKKYYQYEPYAILNYTNKTSYERHWNKYTLACRGLIYNVVTEEVIARPFPKFFNWSEPEAEGLIPTDNMVRMYDKEDGSLGIIYLTSKGLAVATRGSFHSEQAEWATEWLNKRGLLVEFFGKYIMLGRTPLVEIIYPENRIVLDYGDTKTLAFLATVDNATGRIHFNEDILLEPPAPYGSVVAHYREGYEPLTARPNKEGVIVHDPVTNNIVKMKQPDYIEKHKYYTNFSPKTVWSWLSEDTFDDYVKDLPDELYDEANKLKNGFHYDRGDILQKLNSFMAGLPKYLERRDYAIAIQKELPKALWALAFAKLDKDQVKQDSILWKLVEPKGDSNEKE